MPYRRTRCPKCGCKVIKAGKQKTRQGAKQRYLCSRGHITVD